MNKKILWITETAMMLALLICLQWAGSFVPNPLLKQLITGSFVNCILAVTALLIGMRSGITVACVPGFLALRPTLLPYFQLCWEMFAMWYYCDCLSENGYGSRL